MRDVEPRLWLSTIALFAAVLDYSLFPIRQALRSNHPFLPITRIAAAILVIYTMTELQEFFLVAVHGGAGFHEQKYASDAEVKKAMRLYCPFLLNIFRVNS